MYKKSIYWMSGIIVALVLFGGIQASAQGRSGSKAPVITHGFAVEKIRYGDILRIYLEAEDPKGEMLKIATLVDQVAYGRYPTHWVYLKPTDRKRFKGYLQWNTFSSKTHVISEWTSITVTVSVFDQSGNESNVITFPVTFEIGGKGAASYPVPPPFDQKDVSRLGFINIDLMDLTIMRGDD